MDTNFPSDIYKPIIGGCLHSAYRFIVKKKTKNQLCHISFFMRSPRALLLDFWQVLQELGGILSPLIIFAAWTTTKGASGTVAIFIFFFIWPDGQYNIPLVDPSPTLPLTVAALFGGIID